ncbi:MAG TPA: hypothetical protein VG496_08490, partial [Myxococcales bacterium]|nr:hypothetical protein [Myxococcales bacterium]
MTARLGLAASLLAATFGCSDEAPPIPADRSVLLWYGSAAQQRNQSNLPPGFRGPDEHACAADPTRTYLAELFIQHDVQVKWHWAPIVGGPDSNQPTLNQPEFSLAGTLADASESTSDLLADHPFGFDFVSDVTPDPAFAFLVFGEPTLHPEIEMGTFPRADLSFFPQQGDRTLMRGVWVLDCGHPPYGAEMHPPTFVSDARTADARTTIAMAVVAPYRSSLLFNPDPALSADFASTARFSNPATRAFSIALQAAVLAAAFDRTIQHLSTHALMTANRFDTLDWAICAPLPRPIGATLEASWRFTTRTGVTLVAQPLEADGCVRFTATMTSAYQPMPLAHLDAEWSWDEINRSASDELGSPIDVRQALIDSLTPLFPDAGQIPALQLANNPLIDAYAALHTRPGA